MTAESLTQISDVEYKMRLMLQADNLYRAMQILMPLIADAPENLLYAAEHATNEFLKHKLSGQALSYAKAINLAQEAFKQIEGR